MMRVADPALKRVPDNFTRGDQVGPGARPSAVRRGTRPPQLRNERRLLQDGFRLVAGVDEVGRGAWAGPLSVGVAVVDPSRRRLPTGLRDSKLLPEDTREAIFERVGTWCAAWAVGHAAPEECDRLGMTAALRLATRRAMAALPGDVRPDAVLLDGNFDYVSRPAAPTLFEEPDDAAGPSADAPGARDPVVRTLVKADAVCASVAAASVLAKVTRDRLMRAMADSYPPFEFERNKGYPSPAHKRALCGYGLSAIHRRSWVFTERLPWR